MKPMPSTEYERSERNEQSAGSEHRKIFNKAIAYGVISLLVIMLLGSRFQIGHGSDEALFIDKNGRVGIGTTNPKAELEVAGSAKINGPVGINRIPAQDQHLAVQPLKDHIPLNVTDPSGTQKWLTVTAGGNVIMDGGSLGIGTTDPKEKLEVVGNTKLSGNVVINGGNAVINSGNAVINSGNVVINGGNVGIGTDSPRAKLEVVGDAHIRGQVTRYARYQRDDDAETFYELSPRYHLSLTGVKYGGRTKQIPQDTLEALCADPDGCQVRLAMTRWDSDAKTESASVFFTFYYSAANGRWRASSTDAGNASGVDGDQKTKHVREIWETCYFTDGTYNQYKNQGDQEKGMQLLVWNKYKNNNRTCELTLID